jgi:excinuclease ABC subunit C
MTIHEKLKTVPKKPGVYLFKGARERVLYVGKAKSLRSRLRSYFVKQPNLDGRKMAMVRRVQDFSYLVTDTEIEALALEANLIKQHKPRYNVILRDDKNYPYLKLTMNEEWPRLEVVRRIVHDGSLYFGPFVPTGAMYETLAFIRRHFGIRPCRYKLDKQMRPCIEHQMGRCPAPCDGKISKEDYLKSVNEVKLFLEGRKEGLIQELEGKMQRLSEQMMYEQAAKVRDRIEAVKTAWANQKVISPELGDLDVIGYVKEEGSFAFQVFFIRNGLMIGAKDFYLRDMDDIAPAELLKEFIETFYAKEIIPPGEIVARVRPADSAQLEKWLSQRKKGKVRFIVLGKGKKRELLLLAGKNAEEKMRARKAGPERKTLEELKERLSLKKMPETIGAFDVSTIQGAYSVGAFIYWAEGGFNKNFYRHLKIKGLPERAVDDYAMMEEIVGRTLTGLGEDRPELVIIDGGKGQLEAARKALEGIPDPPELIAVAKGPDRVFTLDSGAPIDIEDGSPSSLLLKRLRDEAHRFAITFHKKLRAKGMSESPLMAIKGMSAKKRYALLKEFGSLAAIREAPVEEIRKIEGIGPKMAARIKGFLTSPESDRIGTS